MRIDPELRQTEMELRILCLLSSAQDLALTEKEILSYDYETTYGESNLVPYADLHGDFAFKRSESLVRAELTRAALKNLSIRGLICPAYGNLYPTYALTKEGAFIVDSLDNEYAHAYCANSKILLGGKSG